MDQSFQRKLRGCFVCGVLFFILFFQQIWADDLDFSISHPFSADMFFSRIARIDGDAYPDLIFSTSEVNIGSSTSGVFIAYGNSSHTFDTPVKVLPEDVAAIAVEYIDSDTLLDIVVVSGVQTQTGYVLLNTGSRTFDTTTFSLFNNYDYSSLAVGYFNSDPYPDIICGDYAATTSEIHFGDGTGGFPTDTILPFGAGGVAVADFNEDGIDDIVNRPLGEADTVAIYLNDSTAHFTLSAKEWAPGTSGGITTANGAADFNNDGHADFAMACFIDPPTSFLVVGFGDGSGGISQLDTFRLTGYHLVAEALDIDGDNNMDIVSEGGSAIGPGTHVAIFRGDGAGNFNDTVIAHGTSAAALALAAADVDLDGSIDLVTGAAFAGPHPITIMYNQLSTMSVHNTPITISGFTESAGARATTGSRTSVRLDVTDPAGQHAARLVRSVADAAYWRRDIDNNNYVDEQIVNQAVRSGTYTIVARPNPTALNGNPFSLRVKVKGYPEAVLASNYDYFNGGSAHDSIAFHYTFGGTSPVQPRNGIASGSTMPAFTWPAAMGATAYEFQLDRYHDFRAPLYTTNSLTTPTFTPGAALGMDSVYYWRYRSFSGSVWSDYSTTYAAYISACCTGMRGNVDGSANDNPTVTDLTYMINYLFLNGPFPPCEAEGNVNGIGGINVTDNTYLVRFLFGGGPAPANCPSF